MQMRIVGLLSSLFYFYFIISLSLSFPYILPLAMISSTVLNKSGSCGHICVISDFRGNVCSIIPFSIVSDIYLSYRVYYGEVCFFPFLVVLGLLL